MVILLDIKVNVVEIHSINGVVAVTTLMFNGQRTGCYMPDIFFATQDEIPEELRTVSKQGEDGRFVVNVVPKVKLDEFRDNNIRMRTEFEPVKNTYEKIKDILGDDVDAFKASYEELRGIAARVKDGQLVENKGLEEALAERTKEMKKSLETQITANANKAQVAEQKVNELSTRLRRTNIHNKVSAAALDEKLGVQRAAIPDLLNRAESVFEPDEDGNLTPKSGGAILYGADGITPMTVEEWIASLKEKCPHYFNASTGGAGGGGDQKFGGFSAADVSKMTPMQKLELANAQQQRRR